jgi:hypothetical protein
VLHVATPPLDFNPVQNVEKKNQENPKTSPDLLSRRNRSVFVLEHKSWSDHRAWLASCLLHTVFLVALGLLWRPIVRGTQGEADRPVGIALVHETNQGNEYFLAGGSNGTADASNERRVVNESSLTVNDASGPPISVENILAELIGNSNSSIDANSSLDGSLGAGLSGDGKSLGSGTGNGVGKGNQTKTSFFGVEGTGASFVFVVDRSESMNVYDAGPLRSAKREMLKSLAALRENHQFQVVFYNDSLSPLTRERGLLFGSESNLDRAESFIKSMRGDGGTEHIPALKLGLSFGSDVLFFLTDAENPSLSMEQLLDLQRRAERSLTTIHSIQFNVGPAASSGGWIRALAEMNRGTYKYIDVTTINEPLSK